MIGRLAVCALLAAQVVPAFAAKDEVEYLIPEDWDSKKDEAKPAGGLPLTSKELESGMKKRFKEVPQCSGVAFGKAQAMKNGEVIYQTLSLKGAQLEMFVEINSAGKVGNAKFLGSKGAKDDPELRLMMCSTYAVMRTLQPELESSEAALKSSSRAWTLSKQKPFEMAFYFNKIKTQYVPFEMNVY
ncbi:hypothetical protein [Pseudomonas protegens]|uniref:hypothetical protein n=2 Tax=Pseudomonas TaxID=286 RepID=UPI000E1EC61A|nr:hypothetical protein [Pseudomonas protegens]AXK52617.1 hypothetical protein DWF74_04365 [Pseudomonas protegens]